MKNSDRTNAQNNIPFEQTAEGRRILLEIQAMNKEWRMNEHNGEIGILTTFSKRNKTKYYTSTVGQDLEKMVKTNTKVTKHNSLPQVNINHLNQNNDFLQSNFPKS